MRIAQWNDYELLDACAGERLERWGDIILIRPDPQIIWNTEKQSPLWRSAHARLRALPPASSPATVKRCG